MRTSIDAARLNSPTARLLALTVGVLLSAGCSDDGYGQRYPVSGIVKYKGELLKKGSINFVPTTPEGRPATGAIVDGVYDMTTFAPSDGVIPGPYKISISAADVDMSKAEAAAKAGGGALDEMLVVKAQKKSKSLIPKKYSLPDTSGLTKEVKAESNTFELELVD